MKQEEIIQKLKGISQMLSLLYLGIEDIDKDDIPEKVAEVEDVLNEFINILKAEDKYLAMSKKELEEAIVKHYQTVPTNCYGFGIDNYYKWRDKLNRLDTAYKRIQGVNKPISAFEYYCNIVKKGKHEENR